MAGVQPPFSSPEAGDDVRMEQRPGVHLTIKPGCSNRWHQENTKSIKRASELQWRYICLILEKLVEGLGVFETKLVGNFAYRHGGG